jgi:DNA-binding GntR family transcriptional regulator
MTDAFRSTLADQAYASIKAKLAGLNLMPGDRMAEKELAEQLGISRTPVRQALQRLHHEGLLDLLPKLGWAVPRLDFQRLDELYDFRIVIEQHAARLCAGNTNARVRLTQQREIWCVPRKKQLSDPTEVGELDEQFHTELVSAAGNREMIRAHAYITDHIRLIRRLDFIKPERVCATYEEHAVVLESIFAQKAGQAQSALSQHILTSKNQSRDITLQAMFERRQVMQSEA